MIKNVIVVTGEPYLSLYKNIAHTGVEYKSAYAWNSCFFQAAQREAYFRLKLPKRKIWYNKQLTDFKGTYIVFTGMMDYEFLLWLRKHNPASRIILYFATPVKQISIGHYIDALKQRGVEIWTFYHKDAQEYDLRYNHYFFLKQDYEMLVYNEQETIFDIFFIGRDKGRLEYIHKLQEKTSDQHLSWYVHVTADHFYQYFKKRKYKKQLSHNKALKLQIKAKAVMDLVPEGYNNITVRVLGAMYLNQKLIINNSYAKQLDLYNKNNIYVIEDSNKMTIKEFLDLPYKPVPNETKMEYSFDRWLDRFFEGVC